MGNDEKRRRGVLGFSEDEDKDDDDGEEADELGNDEALECDVADFELRVGTPSL